MNDINFHARSWQSKRGTTDTVIKTKRWTNCYSINEINEKVSVFAQSGFKSSSGLEIGLHVISLTTWTNPESSIITALVECRGKVPIQFDQAFSSGKLSVCYNYFKRLFSFFSSQKDHKLNPLSDNRKTLLSDFSRSGFKSYFHMNTISWLLTPLS